MGYVGGNVRRDYGGYEDHFGGQPEPYQGGRDTNNLNSVKLTIPSFKGCSDPVEYIEWKLAMERIFDTNDMTEDKKVKYAISSFESFASTWRESVKRSRRRNAMPINVTWGELIRVMDEKYVTQQYHVDQYK